MPRSSARQLLVAASLAASGCARPHALGVPALSPPPPSVPVVAAAPAAPPPRAAAPPPVPARLPDPPPPLADDARFSVEGRAAPPAGAHALVREPSGNVEVVTLSARTLACLRGHGAAYARFAVTSGRGGAAARVLASEGPVDAVACAERAVVRELHRRPDDDPLEVEVLLVRP